MYRAATRSLSLVHSSLHALPANAFFKHLSSTISSSSSTISSSNQQQLSGDADVELPVSLIKGRGSITAGIWITIQYTSSWSKAL